MVKTDLRKLNNIAKGVLSILKIKNGTLDIHLVTEAEIRRLNREFRSKDKSTNVLAFPYPAGFPHPESKNIFLGEIYLSPDYIKKHGEDIRFMLLHGTLHLLGFDHVKLSDRIEMEKLEKILLSKLINKSNQLF